jgi:Pyridoxamine 5'-phosphate oxidase
VPPVSWSDTADEVIGGDLTAAVAYVTPAGGAVVTAVAPIGLRDRDAGIVTFTTSLGFGRKLERLRREPRMALAYHARDHGLTDRPEYVLVQGRATIVEAPDREYLESVVQPAAERFMGPPKRGVFWDRWLAAYYGDRVPVHVDVERVVVWRDLRCAGEPEVFGAPLPAEPPAAQAAPKKGAGPRLDAAGAARKGAALPHQLLAYVQADGYPAVAPVRIGAGGEAGIELGAEPGILPPGGRRAGLLAHDYRPKLIGLAARQHTGWLEDGTYAPHTESGFRAPGNKILLLLANGYLARRGLKKARKAQATAAPPK